MVSYRKEAQKNRLPDSSLQSDFVGGSKDAISWPPAYLRLQEWKRKFRYEIRLSTDLSADLSVALFAAEMLKIFFIKAFLDVHATLYYSLHNIHCMAFTA